MTPPLNVQNYSGTTKPSIVSRRSLTSFTLFFSLAMFPAMRVQAQFAAAPLDLSIASTDDGRTSSSRTDALPEDPGARSSTTDAAAPQSNGAALGGAATGSVATISTKYIPPGWTAQPINAHGKLLVGLRDLYNPLNFAGFILGGAYDQVLNSEPNYGTDRGAFGERMGAAAIRGTSQGIFTDTIFAPLLHEDPRYYIEGRQYSFVHRTLYAGTRPLITRTDSGRSTVNGAMLLGYAAAAVLSYPYYPKSNQNVHDTLSTYGGSIGGEALAFVVIEFMPDVLEKLHLTKRQ